MDKEEYAATVTDALTDLGSITQRVLGSSTNARRALEERAIRDGLWRSAGDMVENIRSNEGDQIHAHLREAQQKLSRTAAEWSFNNQNHYKVIPFGPFELRVSVTHMNPIETLIGSDVIYEIRGVKMLAFQHKKRGMSGTLRTLSVKELDQLSKIKKLCGSCGRSRLLPGRLIYNRCASLYVIGDTNIAERHVVSACRLEKYSEVFTDHLPKMQYRTTSIDEADELFATCELGYRQGPEADQNIADKYGKATLDYSRLLISTTLDARR